MIDNTTKLDFDDIIKKAILNVKPERILDEPETSWIGRNNTWLQCALAVTEAFVEECQDDKEGLLKYFGIKTKYEIID